MLNPKEKTSEGFKWIKWLTIESKIWQLSSNEKPGGIFNGNDFEKKWWGISLSYKQKCSFHFVQDCFVSQSLSDALIIILQLNVVWFSYLNMHYVK